MKIPTTCLLVALLFLVFGLVSGCGAAQPIKPTLNTSSEEAINVVIPSPTPMPCPALQQGLTFLTERYNPTLGLLNEAPLAAPNKYWLTNDNAVAAYTFSQLGRAEMSSQIHAALEHYGYEANGWIEGLWGVPVNYPPNVARPMKISTIGNDEIWHEFHDEGPLLEDWAQYANLGFLGALNAYYQGYSGESLAIYANTLAQFDGTGFQDKAFVDVYETYKLALALYVGVMIKAPISNGDQILGILQSMQTEEGGFRTHYRDGGTPEGDANTETTSLALLALKVYGCA